MEKGWGWRLLGAEPGQGLGLGAPPGVPLCPPSCGLSRASPSPCPNGASTTSVVTSSRGWGHWKRPRRLQEAEPGEGLRLGAPPGVDVCHQPKLGS